MSVQFFTLVYAGVSATNQGIFSRSHFQINKNFVFLLQYTFDRAILTELASSYSFRKDIEMLNNLRLV